MRVLLVHNFYRIPGGEDSIVREELAMLARNGVEAELFSVSSKDIRGALGAIGVGLFLLYNPRSRRALARKLAQYRPDVVHVHNFFPLLSPSILDACRDAGVPTVMTLHNFRVLCPAALLHPDEMFRERSLRHSCWWTVRKKIYRNSALATLALATMVEFHKRIGTWQNKVDRFIALSANAKTKFALGGLPIEKIVVKPNCTSSTGPPGADRRQGALFVGRLDEQKGVRILLEAWREIDYPLRIVGDGPLSELVKNCSNESITFLGRRPREMVIEEMRAAKFLILPSMGHEMFPVTILEAFSCGLPVICSDLPSLKDLVAPKITGLTFAAGDARDLATQARWAIDHASALDQMGARARAVYEAQYTPEVNFDQLMNIYASLLPPQTLRQPRPRIPIDIGGRKALRP